MGKIVAFVYIAFITLGYITLLSNITPFFLHSIAHVYGHTFKKLQISVLYITLTILKLKNEIKFILGKNDKNEIFH